MGAIGGTVGRAFGGTETQKSREVRTVEIVEVTLEPVKFVNAVNFRAKSGAASCSP